MPFITSGWNLKSSGSESELWRNGESEKGKQKAIGYPIYDVRCRLRQKAKESYANCWM
jgi:hypothetical protein